MADATSKEGSGIFALVDGRGESELLFHFGPAFRSPQTCQIICNNKHPYIPSNEDAAIVRAQRYALLELDPLAEPDELLFHRNEYAMSPELFEKKRMYCGLPPDDLGHFNLIHGIWHWYYLGLAGKDYIYKELASDDARRDRRVGRINNPYLDYCIVSPDWRAAIEVLEPGIHEFFPLTLEFCGRKKLVVRHVYVLRTRQIVDPPCADFSFHFRNRPERPFTHSAIRELHWFQTSNAFRNHPKPFVSRALADKLRPLLPNRVELVPVDVE